jgi:hypothetical protein
MKVIYKAYKIQKQDIVFNGYPMSKHITTCSALSAMKNGETDAEM